LVPLNGENGTNIILLYKEFILKINVFVFSSKFRVDETKDKCSERLLNLKQIKKNKIITMVIKDIFVKLNRNS
jgi:hypothetical protein